MQLGQLRRAPAPFARHDLVTVRPDRAHQDGRQHALFLHRGRKVGQRLFVEGLARLIAARLQKSDRQRADVFLGNGLALHRGDFVTDQCGETAAQTTGAIVLGRIHAAALTRSRWINSPASLI